MSYLFDSNILLRLVHTDHPEHIPVHAAVEKLTLRGVRGHYTSQNLSEFWNVTTRPVTSRGGLGCSIAVANLAAQTVERVATFLPDNIEVHMEWRKLLVEHSVRGRQVHDARLAAAIKVHGLTHILTLNQKDFARYPEVIAVHPRDI